jgi:hypothetical protein
VFSGRIDLNRFSIDAIFEEAELMVAFGANKPYTCDPGFKKYLFNGFADSGVSANGITKRSRASNVSREAGAIPMISYVSLLI